MATKQKPLPAATAEDAAISPTDIELARDAYQKVAVPRFRKLLDAELPRAEKDELTVG